MTDDIRETDGEEQEDQEKETYRKEDRRVRLDDIGTDEQAAKEAADAPAAAGDAPADAGDEQVAEAPTTQEAAAAAAQEEEMVMPPLDTRSLMRWCLGLFIEQTWVHMGLRLAPGAKELTTDLPQAKMAIDTVVFLKNALGDDLDSTEKKEMEQVVATLQMNYVQRV